MNKIHIKNLTLLLIITLFAALSYACSDFRVKAKDGTVVIGRSMEFAIDLKSELCVVPAGPGKYGFLGVNAFGLKNTFVEGINEKGLSFDGLMFTGAVYESKGAGRSIPMDDFGAYVLGNFATVEEVKYALSKVNITAARDKKLKDLGMHVAVHDASGKSIVIEFIGGYKQVYDNPLGVMTNRPSFDWQLDNLRNYVNLNARDAAAKTLNGVKIEPTGVGNGLHGLPGDWTPPSRFVRISYSLDAALPTKNAAQAVNLAEHLLNMVDIPKGVIREPGPIPGFYLYGIAQWTLIKDLTNRVLYFRTYDNTAWKAVDLKKFDLAPGASRKSMAIDGQPPNVDDVSGQLKTI